MKDEVRLPQSGLDYVFFKLSGHEFALEVLQVKDVVSATATTKIPRTRPEVYGVLNLRGRIVTVIDTSFLMGLGSNSDGHEGKLYIVVEFEGEDYALLVDEVTDVVEYDCNSLEETPRTMSPAWRKMALGVHYQKDHMLLVIGVRKLLSFLQEDVVQVS